MTTFIHPRASAIRAQETVDVLERVVERGGVMRTMSAPQIDDGAALRQLELQAGLGESARSASSRARAA